MNCERVKCLIGVHDELDLPTTRALQEHIGNCESCREHWLAEGQFRQLMARRPLPPLPEPARQRVLLAVPQHDWRWLRLRLKLLRWAPRLAATVALVAGSAFVARELATRGAPAVGVDPTPVAQPSPPIGLAEVIDLHPTAVAQGEAKLSRSSGAVRVPAPLRPSDGASVPVPRPAAAATPVSEPIAPTPDTAALGGAGRPPTEQAEPPSNEPPGEHGGGHPLPTARPSDTLVPTAQQSDTPIPTAPPIDTPVSTATKTFTPTWSLVLEAWPDLAGGDAACPGCDLALDDRDQAAASRRPIGPALVEVHTLAGGARMPVFEGYLLPEADGAARARVTTSLPPPYEVTFLGALDGFSLCPADTPLKSVDADAWAPGEARAVPFYVWAGCQPPTPTPAATATSVPLPTPTSATSLTLATIPPASLTLALTPIPSPVPTSGTVIRPSIPRPGPADPGAGR